MMKKVMNFKDIMEEFCYIFRDTDEVKQILDSVIRELWYDDEH